MRRLLPLIALLLPTPALADITANYTTGHEVLTVEVDDGGNVRAGIDGKFVLIRRDGVDYIVMYGDGTPRVARASEALARFARNAPPHGKTWRTELSAEGDATVAGHPGSVWRFGPAGESSLEFVMSPDPTLAPVGQVFARVADSFGAFVDTQVGPTGDAATGVRSLFSHGTPIRVSDTRVEPAPPMVLIELQSVSTAEIDAHRFDLAGAGDDGRCLLRRGDAAAADHERHHGRRNTQSEALARPNERGPPALAMLDFACLARGAGHAGRSLTPSINTQAREACTPRIRAAKNRRDQCDFRVTFDMPGQRRPGARHEAGALDPLQPSSL